jgi:hypothetical protein
MKKKTIDELFEERFRDFNEIADEKVWKAIEASLNKKNARKVIPLWWKLGGIAALLAILFFAFNPFGNATLQNEIQLTETSLKENSAQKKASDTIENAAKQNNSDVKIVNDTHQKETTVEKKVLEEALRAYTDEIKKDKANATRSKKEEVKQSFSKTNTNHAIAHQNISEKSKNSQLENPNTTKKQTNGADELNIATTKNKIGSQETLAETDPNIKKERGDKGIIDLKYTFKDKNIFPSKDEEKNAVAKKEDQKKSIFDEIKGREEEIIVEKAKEKWSVGPSVAAVYFNGIGEGSPVHTIFVSNSKSGNVNMSYGVLVAYEVSKKLKVRLGVNKVDYGYTTNQVEFTSSIKGEAPQVENINYVASARGIVVGSLVNTRPETQTIPIENAFDVTANSATLEGNLSQQFGYIEVPLELNYALLDKRFGINVIGGVSSLFLVNNTILLNSGDQTTQMGEANNINDLNFSTNFGVGINYKFSPKLQFSVEPIFKYQLNTFSNTAGNFQPFSVGVFSGFSLRF